MVADARRRVAVHAPHVGAEPFPPDYDFGSTFEAVLDLNNGTYSAVGHGTRTVTTSGAFLKAWNCARHDAFGQGETDSAALFSFGTASSAALEEKFSRRGSASASICVARLKTDGGKGCLNSS